LYRKNRDDNFEIFLDTPALSTTNISVAGMTIMDCVAGEHQKKRGGQKREELQKWKWLELISVPCVLRSKTKGGAKKNTVHK